MQDDWDRLEEWIGSPARAEARRRATELLADGWEIQTVMFRTGLWTFRRPRRGPVALAADTGDSMQRHLSEVRSRPRRRVRAFTARGSNSQSSIKRRALTLARARRHWDTSRGSAAIAARTGDGQPR
jgi:hypothetical protein